MCIYLQQNEVTCKIRFLFCFRQTGVLTSYNTVFSIYNYMYYQMVVMQTYIQMMLHDNFNSCTQLQNGYN